STKATTAAQTLPHFSARRSKKARQRFSVARRHHSQVHKQWGWYQCVLVDDRRSCMGFRILQLLIHTGTTTTSAATSEMADAHASCGASYVIRPKMATSMLKRM
ncbi:hypothetical protein LINPERHAP1_LOCUS21810, partial [Linum perenne]